MNYAETVAALERRGIMPDRPPGLESIQAALARVDPALDPARTIVVAGTNGKGSTAATLEALLLSTGANVGLYTSPHLIETTERIRINGRDIPREEFTRAYAEFAPRTEDLRLSHFEMLTLMAAWSFQGLDWIVLEVGLGGKWDATNAIPHSTAVITKLGLDHQNLLGDTLAEIALNKLEITPRPGGLVVHQPFPAEIAAVVSEFKRGRSARWRECEPFEFTPPDRIRTRWGDARLNLPGPRGAENTMLALTVFDSLGLDPAKHLGALGRVRWPGRMSRIGTAPSGCPIYASGDHNPQGIRSLLELLPLFPRRRLRIVAGVGRAKDVDGVLEPLFTELRDRSIHLTVSPFQGRTREELGRWAREADSFDETPEAALKRALREAGPEDLILITGSLYLVGEIMRVVESQRENR